MTGRDAGPTGEEPRLAPGPLLCMMPLAFDQPSRELAQELLGQTLVRVLDDGSRLAGRIVETEAYLGVKDKAAHAFGGRRTQRNESMYARAGTAYVYFTYGMHHCFNVVAGEVDEPVAVLIRALEPTEGLERMAVHRASNRRSSPLKETDLCSGPAKLCQALAIDRELDGEDLTSSDRIFIETTRQGPIELATLVNRARIGVDYAEDWAQRRLRWYIRESAHVSVR